MSRFFAIADDRFLKRPQLYITLFNHAHILSKSLGIESTLLFFGKADSILNDASYYFNEIKRYDSIILGDSETAKMAFSKAQFAETASAALFLHHSIYETLYEITVKPFSSFHPDVIDITYESGSCVIHRPIIGFSHIQNVI
jgi:hypothetical protein